MIEDDNTRVVIDSGPDFRQQMLQHKVNRLDAIVFTHEHKDHIAGLDDVRGFNFVQKSKMNVYATEKVQQALKREFAYVFSEIKYPGIPEIELHTITHQKFKINTLEFEPIDVMHMHLPVLAFRIKDFCYITDANFISPAAMEKIKGSKVIVINALRKEKHASHFTMDEAIDVLKQLNPEKAYFTHISHQLGLHDEVNASLPSNIQCGYDGLSIEV